LAVSSGLLSQQVENLTQQLSTSEQKETQAKLEAEIRGNLLREKDSKINQQEQQIKNYQQLLRTSEENLANCQRIIQQKEEQIEQLEQEKNLIGEELELANGKIRELEAALLAANGKVVQLEARIRELEKQGDNSLELEKLKKELATEKQKSQKEKTKQQQEIKRLQGELASTKKREEELAEKIKGLGAKKEKVPEISETTSFWQTIKTPLFYGVGIVLVVIVCGWLRSKVKDE